jgi:succinylglutamate desuccinylase
MAQRHSQSLQLSQQQNQTQSFFHFNVHCTIGNSAATLETSYHWHDNTHWLGMFILLLYIL